MNPNDKKTSSLGDSASVLAHEATLRPLITYSSPKAFLGSVCARWKSLWTKQFILALLLGQLLSFCITCTSVATTELVKRGLSLPTMQNNILYFLLFITFTPYTIYKYGFKGWCQLIKRDGWKYFILAASDVEGNFLVVKAFSYTDMLSCMLLDAWAIPVCLLFSWLFMRVRCHWTQILSAIICIFGSGLLVASDMFTGKNWAAVDKAKGDAFVIAGATLYGFNNAAGEVLARERPLYEVVGQLGMFGFLLNGIQASALEHELLKSGNWNVVTVALLVAYTAAMFVLYTLQPVIYRLASSTFFNLSLLSRNFYGLLFGLILFHYRPYWLYFVSLVVVIFGLITYFWSSAPEEQGIVDPQLPQYVIAENDKTLDTSTADTKVIIPNLTVV